MAIYTQYGRYLKAKMLQSMLSGEDAPYEAYMLFGIGNPMWDADNIKENMSIAPYDTSILSADTVGMNNQFEDKMVYLQYMLGNGSDTSARVLETITNSTPQTDYFKRVQNLIPPFPVRYIKNEAGEEYNQTYDGLGDVTLSTLGEYIIVDDILKKVGNTDGVEVDIKQLSSDTASQMYAEMYMRGSLYNKYKDTPIQNALKLPVGLLGAIKCKVDFVKDIGQDESHYTGDITEFYYGDRYWKVVYPKDELPEEFDEYIQDDESKIINQTYYPNHLIFTTILHPRYLCNLLKIDKHIVPRQIAIYYRKKKAYAKVKDIDKYALDEDYKAVEGVLYDEGARYYRADEHIFNFGQYTNTADTSDLPNALDGMEILNFNLPANGNKAGEFKFLLNDYIHGASRDTHTADRFGYVVGF